MQHHPQDRRDPQHDYERHLQAKNRLKVVIKPRMLGLETVGQENLLNLLRSHLVQEWKGFGNGLFVAKQKSDGRIVNDRAPVRDR